MKEDPYFVEVEANGCLVCGAAQTWAVIGPDGAASSVAWTDKEDADHFAECMNDAFYRGASSERKACAKVARDFVWYENSGCSPDEANEYIARIIEARPNVQIEATSAKSRGGRLE